MTKQELYNKIEREVKFGPPLFHRVMRKVHTQPFCEYEGGSTFKIMSYNLLADRLMLKNATHLLPKDPCHDPEYRMTRILAEIEQSCPDILCLQEVSTRTTYPFLLKELTAMGYQIEECKSAAELAQLLEQEPNSTKQVH